MVIQTIHTANMLTLQSEWVLYPFLSIAANVLCERTLTDKMDFMPQPHSLLLVEKNYKYCRLG